MTSDRIEVAVRVNQFGARTNGNDCDKTVCERSQRFSGAAALFIMTAVFARTMWKYGRARAYRVVLLETGHLCQTFCLTATRLGLAPFGTAALKDSLIEKDLGLDGISESVLYVAGIGLVRPAPREVLA